MRVVLLILVAVATMTLGVEPAAAQNLNCRNPAGPTDVQVCRYPHLGELDDRLERRYRRIRRDLGGYEIQQFDADHLRWRRARRDCGPNVPCIEALYHRRLDELREYRGRRYN
jgi:uncharacterized protein